MRSQGILFNFVPRGRPVFRGTTQAEPLQMFYCSNARQVPIITDSGLWNQEARSLFVAVFRSEVMTGCLLVGASYALLNTQTHAVGAVAAVGDDSKVRASFFLFGLI